MQERMRALNFNTVALIADTLNKSSISWAVGASVMLYFHGLVASPNDMDIIVREDDIEKALDALDSIGSLTYDGSKDHSEIYLTEHFYKYQVKDVEMDVMSGFRLRNSEDIYEFTLDDEAVVDFKEVNGAKIPLTSLEDWYVLYQLMVNREAKVRLIEDCLISNGIKNKMLLERALDKELPKSVRDRIHKMLK